EITKVLGETFLALGEWADAETLLAESVALLEPQLGAHAERTLATRARWCECLDRRGDQRALAERERLLADLRAHLGPDHELAITTLDGVAHTCRTTGDLARSRALHVEAVERASRVLGAEHRHTLVARNNLALTESALGAHAAAVAIDREVWAIRQRVLGADHPFTLGSQANLALHLWYDRDAPGYPERLAEAAEHTTAARRGRERVLGPDHPETLLSGNNLMLIQMDRRDLVAAEATGRELVARYRQKLGEEHEDSLRAMANFVDLLCRTDDRTRWLEAEELAATTLANARRRYDGSHWMLGWHLMCAAVPALRLQQDLDAARELTVEALANFRATLGDRHARTRGAARRLVVRGAEFGWTIDSEWQRLVDAK
ncbi:MAG: tetratricopeptide repeat protein, partial [Planctomycetota bacterium]